MTPSSPERARDIYLAWQAEIGTEEVVLTAPWVRPASPGAGPLPKGAGAPPGGPESQQGFRSVPPASLSDPSTPKAGPEFFQSIAEKLAKSAAATKTPARGTSARTTAGTASPSSTPAPALPEFQDLDSYRAWLAEAWPQWFPGVTGPLARAEGHPSPRLAVVSLSASLPAQAAAANGAAEGGLFGPEAGVLFDKMMGAIGLKREDMYLTCVMKTAPARPEKPWARKDVARAVPALFRELRLARCGLVLLLGETCAQAVLRTGRGIPELLKAAAETDGLSLSATWHPDEILASGNDKALRNAAWEHLQWLRGLLPARGS